MAATSGSAIVTSWFNRAGSPVRYTAAAVSDARHEERDRIAVECADDDQTMAHHGDRWRAAPPVTLQRR